MQKIQKQIKIQMQLKKNPKEITQRESVVEVMISIIQMQVNQIAIHRIKNYFQKV